ncbi:gliding motility-associated C-terminal domain-containing protein [Flavobacterium sp. H122]|uniref:gliding motility-associated C-terminal domain-containing protein n=1 Tax=Flavobacterium sp. H122 TaxID=2529860 RepID=UPI00145B5238|nr:gliding motility-associated C-terminal domain-containing protein [Flavobacterium sp. H122]
MPTPTTNDTTQDFCQSNNPTIASLQVNQSTIVWYDAATGGNVLSSSALLVDGVTYYAGIIDPVSGCSSTTRLAITVDLKTADSASIDDNTDKTCDFEPVTYSTQGNMSNYEWTIGSGGQIVSGGGSNDSTVTVNWTQLGSNSVTVSYLNSSVCNSQETATFNLVVESCVLPVDGCLTIFNEFTPNGDGSNEFFYIVCAENYPNNKLEIYNRYGNLVFQTRGYKNDWKGIANVKGTFNDNVLPTGTYYYVFETGDNTVNQAKSGWLYIMR